jgi:hypothetical protein
VRNRRCGDLPRSGRRGTHAQNCHPRGCILFGRLMAVIDRLLMASAAIAIRNGDPPYFGL